MSQSRNASAGQRLSKTSIYMLVKALLNQLDIKNSTHGFRHRFITDLIDTNANLMAVKKLSRHSNLNMLNVYYDENQDIADADSLLSNLKYKLV